MLKVGSPCQERQFCGVKDLTTKSTRVSLVNFSLHAAKVFDSRVPVTVAVDASDATNFFGKISFSRSFEKPIP
jgi:hypothetical protein